MGIKIWLDDTREAPEGWIRVLWPDELFSLCNSHKVDIISLDHDLGNDKRGTGYDVLLAIERAVVENKLSHIPEIRLHTANPAARQRMQLALEKIQLMVEENRIEKEGVKEE